jgi:hypothetical protein
MSSSFYRSFRPLFSRGCVPLKMVDQRWLILPRYTQPSLDTKLLPGLRNTQARVGNPSL